MFYSDLSKYAFSWVENSKLKHIFSEKNRPDIIITHNTDIAIALKYDESMTAPTIQEKGRNTYAKKLIDVGKKYNVPIVENKELANELFILVKTNQSIPYKYFTIIMLLYVKYANFYLTKKDNYFEEMFEIQRLKKHEILSLIIPERIKIEVSNNIYDIIKDKCFNINIFGFVINNIKTEENNKLENYEYNIKVNGLLVKNGKIMFTFVEPFEQLNIYLSECLKIHYKQLIGRDEIVYFISQINEKYPTLINEIIKYYSIGEIRKVLHELLDENISIQNIVTILEVMADFGNKEHKFDIILESVRKAIGRDICFPYLYDNVLKTISFEYELEKTINANFINVENVVYLNNEYVRIVHECILKATKSLKNKNIKPVLVLRTKKQEINEKCC